MASICTRPRAPALWRPGGDGPASDVSISRCKCLTAVRYDFNINGGARPHALLACRTQMGLVYN